MPIACGARLGPTKRTRLNRVAVLRAAATGNSGAAPYHVHTGASERRPARDRARVRGRASRRTRSRAWKTCVTGGDSRRLASTGGVIRNARAQLTGQRKRTAARPSTEVSLHARFVSVVYRIQRKNTRVRKKSKKPERSPNVGAGVRPAFRQLDWYTGDTATIDNGTKRSPQPQLSLQSTV